ncbi:MAG: hypothetical protein RJA70_2911 [Pseudomonadota bacterium]|jgi:L-alanine-DL-glutamate epimerase-like enolase superfamily enzyme
MPNIVAIRVRALDINLNEPFGIATGAQHTANNVFVEVETRSGFVGYGEAAPFPAVNGETQAQAESALNAAKTALLGKDVTRYGTLCDLVSELTSGTPSAGCALECALMDAFGKVYGLSLWRLWGGREPTLCTDLTIPTGDLQHARSSAERAAAQGFNQLKLKVGAADPSADVRRIIAICEAAPHCRLILDANGGFSAEDAVRLIAELGSLKERVALYEQPTARGDWEGLGKVRHDTGLLVAADESADNVRSLQGLIRANCIDVVNLKITKTGLTGAIQMAQMARGAGLKLMIGGMVESQLTMSVSACLAAGMGGVEFVDLDTPLFMRDAPLRGGYLQKGSELDVTRIVSGHGVQPT